MITRSITNIDKKILSNNYDIYTKMFSTFNSDYESYEREDAFIEYLLKDISYSNFQILCTEFYRRTIQGYNNINQLHFANSIIMKLNIHAEELLNANLSRLIHIIWINRKTNYHIKDNKSFDTYLLFTKTIPMDSNIEAATIAAIIMLSTYKNKIMVYDDIDKMKFSNVMDIGSFVDLYMGNTTDSIYYEKGWTNFIDNDLSNDKKLNMEKELKEERKNHTEVWNKFITTICFGSYDNAYKIIKENIG